MHNSTAEVLEHRARGTDTETTGRLATLRATSEEGAQAVEYAMIAGLGAGVIGLAWTAISSGLIRKLIVLLFEVLSELVSGWF